MGQAVMLPVDLYAPPGIVATALRGDASAVPADINRLGRLAGVLPLNEAVAQAAREMVVHPIDGDVPNDAAADDGLGGNAQPSGTRDEAVLAVHDARIALLRARMKALAAEGETSPALADIRARLKRAERARQVAIVRIDGVPALAAEPSPPVVAAHAGARAPGQEIAWPRSPSFASRGLAERHRPHSGVTVALRHRSLTGSIATTMATGHRSPPVALHVVRVSFVIGAPHRVHRGVGARLARARRLLLAARTQLAHDRVARCATAFHWRGTMTEARCQEAMLSRLVAGRSAKMRALPASARDFQAAGLGAKG